MEGEKLRGSYEVTVSNVDDGEPGSPGESYYTWVKYADDLHGAGMADIPNGKYYIGLAFNKESSTASNNPQDYQWSKYRGDNGESGIVVSAIPPDNPQVGQLWQTESGQPIMRWDGARWVLHYIAVENLNVKKLSAITSDLGTVNAGEINGVTIKGTRITGSSLIELQNKTKDGGLMWVKGNSEGLEVIKFSSTGTRVAGVRITEEDIFVDGATRSFKGLNSDMNKTLQEPKLLVGGKTLAQGGSFVASGVRGLLLLEVANSSARSRKMEVFIKGINAERNIHISYADGTSLNITIAVTWSGSNATIKCTRFWAEGQWSGGTSQIYYAYTI